MYHHQVWEKKIISCGNSLLYKRIITHIFRRIINFLRISKCTTFLKWAKNLTEMTSNSFWQSYKNIVLPLLIHILQLELIWPENSYQFVNITRISLIISHNQFSIINFSGRYPMLHHINKAENCFIINSHYMIFITLFYSFTRLNKFKSLTTSLYPVWKLRIYILFSLLVSHYYSLK